MFVDLQKEYRGNLDWLVDRTIFATVHGSHCYGTSTPESDVDVKGVCIPPRSYLHGFAESFEQAEQAEPDMVIYSLQKFMNLASQCNPNIIEVLFTDPEFWVKVTPLGQKLYENRRLFLSKKVRYTFSGYAFAQLKRIKGHRAWLLNPPTKKPERADFGLGEQNKVSASALGTFKGLEEKGYAFDDGVVALLQTERAYHNALVYWQQYEAWKLNRNKKRAADEAEHGLDLKHAYHLVRLLRMGKEILTTGEVIVKRPDAEELLAIRNGAWSYDKIVEWAETQEKELEPLYQSSTVLPHKPDIKKLQQLCVELTEEMLG